VFQASAERHAAGAAREFPGVERRRRRTRNAQARRGRPGLYVRLLETGGRAWLCNATEDKLREIPASKDGVEVALSPYAIVTLRVLMRPAAP